MLAVPVAAKKGSGGNESMATGRAAHSKIKIGCHRFVTPAFLFSGEAAGRQEVKSIALTSNASTAARSSSVMAARSSSMTRQRAMSSSVICASCRDVG